MSERPIRSRPTPFFRHGFWSHLFLSLVFVSVIRVVGGKGEPAHLVGHGRSLPVYKKKIFPFDDYQCYLFLARIYPELGHPSKSSGFEDFLPLLLLLPAVRRYFRRLSDISFFPSSSAHPRPRSESASNLFSECRQQIRRKKSFSR